MQFSLIRKLCFAICLASALAVNVAQATPLNLVLARSPDIFASGISVQYSSGVLNMFGDASLFTHLDQPPYLIHNTSDTMSNNYGATGAFSLTANIGNDGVATSGTFSIGGFIQGLTGFGDVGGEAGDFSLLTGNLINFGYAEGPDGKLEFTFQVTGGDLAPLYGAEALIVITQIGEPMFEGDFGFPGNFAGDFNGTNMAVGDIGAIPEPSTWVLFASAVGLMLFVRHQRAIRKPHTSA